MVVNAHPTSPGFPQALIDAALRAAAKLPARIPVFGLSGLQGTGKSTLAAQIAAAARQHGQRVAVLSLDDLYLPKADRQHLARTVHPLLATRGPPGTHDTALGCRLIDALASGQAVQLPRFDKLADDRRPPDPADSIDSPVDLILFEGWCLGVPPQADSALDLPLNDLERHEDPHAHWRRHCNTALAHHYPALWQRLHTLWFLQPPSFDIVLHWRTQQEQQLAATHHRPPSMDPPQLARFIQHFERISRHALDTLPTLADHVIPLDEHRRPK